MNNSALIRNLVIYAIVLPVALLLGYLAVGLGPDFSNGEILSPSVMFTGITLSVLFFPLLLKWHHQLLFLSWQAAAVVFFLPGRPELWMFMALVSFTIVLVQRALSSESLLPQVPFVLWPLLFILAVVLITAYLTGGIHLGSLGSSSLGGRKYLYMIAGVIGYIAMTSYRISEKQTMFYVGAFFMATITNAAGDLVHFAGSWLQFILIVFPTQTGSSFLDTDTPGFQTVGVFRDYGITVACMGVVFYILARFGLRNVLEKGIVKKLVTLALCVGCLLGGFRGALVLVSMTAFFMFWLQGLFRTKYAMIAAAGLVLCLPLLPFADKLPDSIQRTLTIVPFAKVSVAAQMSAESTTEWRIQMWKNLLPQVPKYFWLGKGCIADTSDYVSTIIAQQQGQTGDAASQMMIGDYHNGPLSVIIPFGIWGMIGWIWFLAAALRALYLNYRFGQARLKIVNTFLLAHFIAKTVLFFLVFGGFETDLAIFAGIVALSICLNEGVASRASAPVSAPAFSQRRTFQAARVPQLRGQV
jgi:hypothetical protein